MVNDSDVAAGQVYELLLPEHEGPVLAEYRECIAEPRTEVCFVFSQKYVNAPILIDKSEFDQMRSDGRANRLGQDGSVKREPEIDPLALLPIDDDNITVGERKRRVLARQRLQEAQTLRHYCLIYDAVGDVGRGTVGVRNFIRDHYSAAKELKLTWKPSPGALIRAVKECGSPFERHLGNFYDRRGKHDREQRWPEEILKLAGDVIAWYWAKRSRRPIDALALFDRAFRILVVRRAKRGRPITEHDPYDRPHDQTLRNWIKVSRNAWNMEQKYGAKEAHRRLGGRARSMVATEPLEVVLMDHTLIDVWSTVLDKQGNPVAAGRLWLTYAIDGYSRMVLGAYFSYEHPNLNSVMECLRQVVRRKKFLIDEYGSNKFATDGYGLPSKLIVDNGWELVGSSFQASCEAANIDVEWAPVRTPTFKPIVERFFGTLNQNIWHVVDGGIPLTPRDRALLELDPTVDAVHDRERLQALFWQYVVTRYHVDVHSGIGSAPALQWRKGIVAEGRPTIKNVKQLDTIMGITRECLLTAEGIYFDRQRFHDPAITSQLMSELARYSKERTQRKGATSTRSVKVVATASAGNADSLFVWHPGKRASVALPNWDPTYEQGTSWYLLRKVKKYAERENLAYNSPQEQAAARAAYVDAIERAPFTGKFAERKRLAPFRDPTPQLTGNEVTFTRLEKSDDVPQDTAAERTPGERTVPKAPRRGGAAATKRSVATRKKNKAVKAAIEEAAITDNASEDSIVHPTITSSDENSDPRLPSPADRLAELMKQVDEESMR